MFIAIRTRYTKIKYVGKIQTYGTAGGTREEFA